MSESHERILVVEDDPFSRRLLLDLLARQGHARVQAAANGLEAMERVGVTQFDLVLLDIELPEIGGIEILRRLKADPAQRDIPVIVISGVDDTGSVATCIELGAEDYLAKPFNGVVLRARIGASLDKRRLRKQEAAHLERIVLEQRRSDALLEVILPRAAAEELKHGGEVPPRRHDGVAVLFCDIVGFTHYCEHHRAEDVVQSLHALVERYEEITDAHDMEKIKTVGDSFMATAGMLRVNSLPLRSAVHCGQAMIAATADVAPDWQVRIGIDCGPLVSGIIGRQKYQFDVWGSTVNTAARMAEFAPPGGIALRHHLLIDEDLSANSLESRSVKGLGRVEIALLL